MADDSVNKGWDRQRTQLSSAIDTKLERVNGRSRLLSSKQ